MKSTVKSSVLTASAILAALTTSANAKQGFGPSLPTLGSPSVHRYDPPVITPPISAPGDVNFDQRVDSIDLEMLISSIGQSVSPGFGPDLNGDGIVDGADLSVLLANFGRDDRPQPPAPRMPGDANGDLIVNGFDLYMVATHVGTKVTPGWGPDLNGDGIVDGADLSIVLANLPRP